MPRRERERGQGTQSGRDRSSRPEGTKNPHLARPTASERDRAWSHSMPRQHPIDDAVFPDEQMVHGSPYVAHHDRGKHVGAV